MNSIRRSSWKLFTLAMAATLCGVIGAQLNGAPTRGAKMALTGVIASDKEAHMEGVLVSAKKVGGTITVTVASDSQGRYSFPADRLQPGKYELKIRATGYDLASPSEIDIAGGKTARADLTLRDTSDLTVQLMNAEWLMSAPGTQQQKNAATCMVGCHPFAVVAKSKYNSAELFTVMHRMRNYAAASINEPGDWVNPVPLPYEVENPKSDAKLADYLSSVNLSASTNGKWSYDFQTLPRLKGDSTKAIITEYDLPRRGFEPHDVVVDPSDGSIWALDFGGPYLGKLDPRTGGFKEWHVPTLKPGSPAYGLDITLDKDGNPWFTMMEQGGIGKFNKRTQEFSTWRIPAPYDNIKSHVGMVAIAPDGKVWFKDSRNDTVHRWDPKTNHYDSYPLPHEFYGMAVDSHGNLFLASMVKGTIGEIDAETGKFTDIPTPTPDSGSRRGDIDSQDRFWFGENRVGKIGMFDTNTRQFKEWDAPPVPWSDPYYVMPDKRGEAWGGGELTDYIFRLDPTTGQVTQYLLPQVEANIRRVNVDNSTNSVTVWFGENHHAKIAKLEIPQ